MGRWVLVLLVVGAAGRVQAQRRVAVVNVASDEQAGTAAVSEAARRLRGVAGVTVVGGEVATALAEPGAVLARDDAAALQAARTALGEAEQAYRRFEWDAALARLAEAEGRLLALGLRPEVMRGLADVHFEAGLVHALRGDRARATASFRVVHRLAPDRGALDPAVYRQDVVKLFAAAVTARPGAARLRVTTSPPGGDIVLDGVKQGRGEAQLALAEGTHYLGATLPGRAPVLQRIEATAQGPLVLELAPAPLRRRVAEVRAPFLGAAGDRTDAAQAIAALATAEALVLARGPAPNGSFAVYQASTKVLGPWTSLEAALAEVSPARATPAGARDLGVSSQTPASPERPWYRSGWTYGLIGAGVAVVVVGIVIAANAGGDPGYTVTTWCYDCP